MRTNLRLVTTSGKEQRFFLWFILVSRPMMERDERRWKKADQDNDGMINKIEFQAFLHPEDHPTMVDIVVLETLEDMDKDKDGGISEQEYIADIYNVMPVVTWVNIIPTIMCRESPGTLSLTGWRMRGKSSVLRGTRTVTAS